MKSITKNSSFILVVFLILYTCSKETEETNSATNDEIFKNENVESKTVMADWQKFNSTANNLLAIATTNLKSLEAKIKKITNNEEKDALTYTYKKFKNEFNELNNRLENENTVFKRDLKKYNNELEIKNRTFKNIFLHDVIELNNNLEDIVDKKNAD